MTVKSKTNFKIKMLRRFGFFLIGAGLGLGLLFLGLILVFELKYHDKIYPGVKIAGVPVGGQKPGQIKESFDRQNSAFSPLTFTFTFADKIATVSGEKLKVGHDSRLLSDQAFLIGRSGSFATAILQKWQAKTGEINLSPSFRFEESELDKFLEKLAQEIDIPAQEALFQFADGRVTAFRPSSVGRAVNRQKAKKDFSKFLSPPVSAVIGLEVFPVEPKVKTEEANNLGIKELLGEGKSFFQGSIPARVHNLSLASSRLNGLLIAPGEIFSFNQALGEVDASTGYKQAYVIKEKRTVLDDGGGVCQVSTTLFRAALAAGLPIVERQAHAYRVAYYEQGNFGPGLDATVYAPRIDLKIKNDTPARILVQTLVDKKNSSLTFRLFGTADQRKVTLGKAKITDQVPPLPDLYQDDPNLAKGEVKQVDFPAWGAKVAVDWKVEKNGEILQNRTFYSNFQPWQAVYLRGTKE